jgi:hypothetical protein
LTPSAIKCFSIPQDNSSLVCRISLIQGNTQVVRSIAPYVLTPRRSRPLTRKHRRPRKNAINLPNLCRGRLIAHFGGGEKS